MDALSLSLNSEAARDLLRPFRYRGQSFPGIWSCLFPAELWQLELPIETKATCSNCPKICEEGFRPDYRCCTYLPHIPNFLLGLATETPSGARAVDRLLSRGMLLPVGLVTSPQQWLDFMDDQEQGLYGRSTRVLCPLLRPESGLCEVHAFRNAVCATYFCIHEQGEKGEEFWGELQTLGSQIEIVLAQWALKAVDFDFDAYLERLNKLGPAVAHSSSETGWKAEALATLWGDWRGREKELLRATAAQIVQHRSELWSIARQGRIHEAAEFERALDALGGEEPPPEEAEVDSLDQSWQRCLAAQRALFASQ